MVDFKKAHLYFTSSARRIPQSIPGTFLKLAVPPLSHRVKSNGVRPPLEWAPWTSPLQPPLHCQNLLWKIGGPYGTDWGHKGFQGEKRNGKSHHTSGTLLAQYWISTIVLQSTFIQLIFPPLSFSVCVDKYNGLLLNNLQQDNFTDSVLLLAMNR